MHIAFRQNGIVKLSQRLLIMLLALLILSSIACFAFAAEGNVCHIRTAEELVACFSEFTLDDWTRGVVFSLDADVSLSGFRFDPAPIFSGEFRGNGHTVSGLSVEGAPGEAGLFGLITESGSVTALNVQGRIAPKGEISAAGGIAAVNRGRISGCSFSGEIIAGNCAGGIVGSNEGSGVIEGCSFSGSITGMKTAGGIAGMNAGEISFCQSRGEINLDVRDRRLRLRDAKAIIKDISGNMSEVLSIASIYKSENTGGIAGSSSGCIISCENDSHVGSRGNGLNVGGIAGSSSGFICDCTNRGVIGGAANVGGICGLASPFVETGYTSDLLSGPREDFNDVAMIIDTILLDIDSCVNNISGDITDMTKTLQGSMAVVNDLQYQVTDFVNEKIDEVNALGNVVNDVSYYAGDIIDIVNDASDNLKEGVSCLKIAAGLLVEAKDEPDPVRKAELEEEANKYLAEGTDYLTASALLIMEDIKPDLEEIRNILLNGPIPHISGLDPKINETLQQLTYSISGTLGCVNALNLQLKATENILNADIRMLTAKLADIVNNTLDTVASFNFSISAFLSNSSAEDLAEGEMSRGVIYRCDNRGKVTGSAKVGGIAGSMALSGLPEIETDPVDGEGFALKTLDYRLALHSCRNFDSVFSSGDYCGSVCGNSSIGAIMDCEAYGLASSPDGEYVGGIAGFAHGEVSRCYSKCALVGRAYVGGIVGSGAEKSMIYPRSSVSCCISMAGVSSAVQFFGSVAGTAGGSFSENYFVSDVLAGINRYSISGQAEPITYESFDYLKDVPDEFRSISVSFIDDDSEVHSVSIPYGGSLASSDVPKVPGKFGYISHWSTDDYGDLTEDLAVYAVHEFSYFRAACILSALSVLTVLIIVLRTIKAKRRHSSEGLHSSR